MSNDNSNPPRRNAKGQFVRGSSGNPGGRPPTRRRLGVPNQILRDVIELAEQVVEINGPNGKRKITKGELMVESLYAGALKGKVGSQRLFLDWMKLAYAERMERHPIIGVAEVFRQLHEDPNGNRDPAFLSAIDEWRKRLKRL